MTQLDAERRQVLRLGRIADQAGELVGGFQFQKMAKRLLANVAARAVTSILLIVFSFYVLCEVTAAPVASSAGRRASDYMADSAPQPPETNRLSPVM